MKIYHNPMWGKSRKTLQILRDEGVEHSVIDYIKNPLSKKQIKSLISKLGINVQDLIRKNNSDYRNANIDLNNNEECLSFLAENPKLLERPIVENKEKAIIGRPPENVFELFK